MAKFFISPQGVLQHPWVNKPDTAFNRNLYHANMVASGHEAEAMADKIEAAAMAALADHTDQMKPKDAKTWKTFLPFTRITDDDEAPTGDIEFAFKQNAVIKTKDGDKDITVELRDSQNQVTDVQVWDGTVARVMYSMRPYVNSRDNTVGIRLDFAKVQVIELAKAGSAGGQGFGAVEGGYVASQDDHEDSGSDDGGDY